ncbi:MAG: tRNA (adenosine(37)-N6)-dimethylallyltransferase MiaA [Bacilli bacterium]|nr:tRNA (adenosine(37)-N6)-dimethylallyltransferase MiaA [Bacilli bacterium]
MRSKVIVITGPTAGGKTALSLQLATRYNGEIINADASQIRRDLEIGTAKIDWRNQKIKHHLFDLLGPEDPFSIRDYQKMARNLIKNLTLCGKIPFFVGGSGLYINAALGNYDLSIPGRSPLFDRQFDHLGNEDLHKILTKEDPLAAAVIHVNNRRRVLRAISAARAGKKISENLKGRDALYQSLILCLICDREILYSRINERVDLMFDQGWVEEVQTLIEKGVNLQNIKEIGYREIALYLAGEMSLSDVKTLIKTKTRRYSKRQSTWFRNQMDCTYLPVDFADFQTTVRNAEVIVDGFLGRDNKE